MAKFCSSCGTQLTEEAKFCPACGASVPASSPSPRPEPQQEQQTATESAPHSAGTGAVREGIPAPGFSDRVDHPEILAAMKKNRRAGKIFSLILIPLPLIGFVIYGQVSGTMELKQAAIYGGIISAVFLLFALFGLIRDKVQKPYEATVIEKKTATAYRHNNSDDKELITEYITVARTADGKKKKIVEREGSQILAYSYLNVGDRFRYHPQFHFPYELYDKAKAPHLFCVSCMTKNAVEADRCKKCRLPLLK